MNFALKTLPLTLSTQSLHTNSSITIFLSHHAVAFSSTQTIINNLHSQTFLKIGLHICSPIVNFAPKTLPLTLSTQSLHMNSSITTFSSHHVVEYFSTQTIINNLHTQTFLKIGLHICPPIVNFA